MTAKEYLNQYRRANERIREMSLSIQRLEDQLDMQALQYGDKVQSSSAADKMAELVAEICDIKLRKETAKASAMILCAEIEDVIDQVKDADCSKVLYDRYVLNWSFDEIARSKYTSERQVFRWHGAGIQAVEKILKVVSKCQ